MTDGNVFDTFKRVLDENEPHQITNRGFRMRDGQIHTYHQAKKGLTSFYCKRVVLPDLVSTEPLCIAIRPYWREDNIGETDGERVRGANARVG